MHLPHSIVAKELADHKLGRFIFVFSPSVKLSAISGRLSRATVVSVGDLTEPQALDIITQMGCDSLSAAAVHGLIDGHLPFLLKKPVRDFCLGVLDFIGLKNHFTRLVRSVFQHVDQELDCGDDNCACIAACAIRDKKKLLGLTRAVPLLLKEHIVRASLEDKVNKIDSRFALCYISRECSCSNSDYVVTPPCG